MTLLEICTWFEGTPPAVFVRESLYGFQIMVAIHLMGLMLSVGTLLWLDLRLLGVTMQRSRVSEVYRSLAPWFLVGFGIMIVSGLVLFSGFATSAYGNVYFQIKLAAIVLAGTNALIYHFATERAMAGWDEAPLPPLVARLTGLTSIFLWAMVVLAGRMMSYTMF